MHRAVHESGLCGGEFRLVLEVVHVPAAAGVAGRPPVLFVHGFSHGAWCWTEHYAPYFAGRRHDVYAMSLRGHGGSDGRDRLDDAGLDDYVDDVLEVAAGLPTAPVVIGHSMGGAIVQLAVPRAPERFAGAVLLASMVPGIVPRELLRSLRSELSPRAALAKRRLGAGRPLTARQVNSLTYFDRRLTSEQAQRYAGLLQPDSRRALRELLRFRRPAGALPVPLFVIGSARDSIIGAAGVERTGRHYDVDAVVLAEGCHDLMVDPLWEQSASRIADWIDSLPR